jgi:hypothetical protein
MTFLVHLYGITSAFAWIDQADSGDEEQPILCMLEYGDLSVYKRSIYQIQARYHAWVGDWSMHRPKGFPKDEGMGLLVREDVASLVFKLLEIGIQPPLIQHGIWSQSTKENSREEQIDTANCQFSKRQAVANGIQVIIKLRLPKYQVIESTHGIKTHIKMAIEKFLKHYPQSKTKTGWITWILHHPYQNLDAGAENMIHLIKNQIESVSETPQFIDRLFKHKEKGDLQLEVTRKAKLWINGIAYGTWPQKVRIPLIAGIYHLRLQTLEPPIQDYNYPKIEVIAQKLTRLRLTLK